jgi:DNA-binding response OmpR family regulator
MSVIMNKLSSSTSHGEDFTVLTVSADQEDHRLLSDMLSADGWKVLPARSCREAFSSVKANRPAVIACDHKLPDGTWRDLFSLLAGINEPPPLIVVSRNADESLWAEVLNCGGYDVLAKPFDTMEVCRVLSMAHRHGCERQTLVAG